MRIFVDASAIVAMIAHEPEAGSLADRLTAGSERLTAATAVWESVRGVQSARKVNFAEAESLVADFTRDAKLRMVTIGADEADAALAAHRRFGRGVHRAGLNFGDCFAYACAMLHADAILFKDEDFVHTDLVDAMLA